MVSHCRIIKKLFFFFCSPSSPASFLSSLLLLHLHPLILLFHLHLCFHQCFLLILHPFLIPSSPPPSSPSMASFHSSAFSPFFYPPPAPYPSIASSPTSTYFSFFFLLHLHPWPHPNAPSSILFACFFSSPNSICIQRLNEEEK